MDWHERIVSDPETLFGKPRIKGTRIGVELILDLMGSGWSEAQILASYPHLRAVDLQAVLAFARDCLKDETCIMQAAIVAPATGYPLFPDSADSHRGRPGRGLARTCRVPDGSFAVITPNDVRLRPPAAVYANG
ncbi:MAG: DUF433 domain-containing protein [Rhodobacteraceae bacterium]|nr:DUF433 domain-containing protein [Paracoccaceae bacterium]MCB1943990.1 DUF433 domain-containing protein [Accumulibacter sp.]